MKRGQVVEPNRGHWDFEVQHPIAPPGLGTVEQSAMPRSFGGTTRRLRFTRSSTRNDRECSNDLHQNSASAVGTSDRVLRSSQARVSSSVSSTKEASKSSLEIYKDHTSEIVASSENGVDESGLDCLSPELRKVTSTTVTENPVEGLGKDDRGKENVDPLGDRSGTSSGSPLPDWYPRRPLQDITNVLAIGLVRSFTCSLILRFLSFKLYLQGVITCLITSTPLNLFGVAFCIPVFYNA